MVSSRVSTRAVSSYAVTARSDAPADRVFALLADATSWASWAGPMIPRSWWEREGNPPPGGPGAIRRLGWGPLSSREEIVALEPPRKMSYRLLTKALPMRGYRADVVLTAEAGGTRIDWSGSFTTLFPGLGAVTALALRLLLGNFARRVARAAVERSSP